MKCVHAIILFFLSLSGYGQRDSLETFSINPEFSLTSKKLVINPTPVTAFEIGNNYLCFAADGKLSIYDLNHDRWKVQDLTAFTKKEIQHANFGQKKTNGTEINFIKIDNKRDKVGFTLKWAMFKAIEINSLKTDAVLWQGSENYGLEYLKKQDGFIRFTKFYPDEESMDGELDIYLRRDLDDKTHYYAKVGLYSVLLPKISSLQVNANEDICAGISYNHNLILSDKAAPDVTEVFTNIYNNDTLKLTSISFIGNDTLALLYNDGKMFIARVKHIDFQTEIKFNKDQPALDSFVYNEARGIYIGSVDHSEIIIFKIINSGIVIISRTKLNRRFRDFKVSEDGQWLSVL